MEKSGASLVPNKIARYLDKPSEEFTRADIIKYIKENNIEAVNFRHLGGDGRLKTLNFVITSPHSWNNCFHQVKGLMDLACFRISILLPVTFISFHATGLHLKTHFPVCLLWIFSVHITPRKGRGLGALPKTSSRKLMTA
jgi:hypothetical protein